MSFLKDNTRGESIGWKASFKALFIPAIVTALTTIILVFGILLPLRDDPEERTELTVREVLTRIENVEEQLAKQIKRNEKEVRLHRVHSCAQHAFGFLAALDPEELEQFDRGQLRRAFSLCPEKLQFGKVTVDSRHTGGQTPRYRGEQPDSGCLPYHGQCGRTEERQRERPRASTLPETL